MDRPTLTSTKTKTSAIAGLLFIAGAIAAAVILVLNSEEPASPDLTVSLQIQSETAELAEPTLTEEDQVTVLATVENSGQVSDDRSTLSFDILDAATGEPLSRGTTKTIPSIDRGDEINTAIAWMVLPGLAGKQIRFQLTADSSGSISETNEENNTAQSDIYSVIRRFPDLHVGADPVLDVKSGVLSFRIENSGKLTPPDDIPVEARMEWLSASTTPQVLGTPRLYVNPGAPPMPGGWRAYTTEGCPTCLEWVRHPPPGAVSIRIYVDPDTKIEESQRENNLTVIPIPLADRVAVLDTDLDGLTDDEERALGTDIHKKDTDGDGLSDYDEVMKWHTDPLNSDTDHDGYSDGVEVKNGYNPNGPGKL